MLAESLPRPSLLLILYYSKWLDGVCPASCAPMDVRQTVGRNLRRLRVERGLSQEALAHDAGVAPSFVSQIENGLRSPTVTLLQDLADALQTPIVEFFAEGQPVPPQLPRGRKKR